MTQDLEFIFSGTCFDIGRTKSGDLALGNALKSMIFLSLFTDKRASPEEMNSNEPKNRGWWADQFAKSKRKSGSKLWLLAQSTLTDDTLDQAKLYAKDALQWMVEDQIADELSTTAERQGSSLILKITLTMGKSEETFSVKVR